MRATTAHCAAHLDEPTAARCASCDRAMCLACWQRNLDSEPVCAACLPNLTGPISPLVPALASVIGLVVLLRVTQLLQPSHWIAWASLGASALIVVISAWRLTSRASRRRRSRAVALRGAVASPHAAPHHPYRGALRMRVRWLAPPVSAAMTGVVVGSALVMTATLVPALLRLPLWTEVELVLAGWWLVWTIALATLLYRGWRVAQEAGLQTRDRTHRSSGGSSSSNDPGWLGFDLPDSEIVVLLLVLVAGWIAVELFAPLLLLLAYALVVGGLRRVANDTHRCEDQLGRSIAWGAAWATAYTLPLLGLVLLLRAWR